MSSQLEELRQELRTIVKPLEAYWPERDVIWFSDLSMYDVEHWGIKACKSGDKSHASELFPNVPKQVVKMLNLYSKLCHIGKFHYNVGPSLPYDPWGKSGPNWPRSSVKKVTHLWISSCSEAARLFAYDDKQFKSCLKSAVEEVVSKIDDLWRDECLIVHGFPMYFELSIYVLCLIGALFHKIGLVCPEGQNIIVLLYKFDRWDLTTKKLLNKVLREMDGVDPKQLFICGSSKFYDTEFYQVAVDMSYVYFREIINDILENIDKGKKDYDYDKTTEHFISVKPQKKDLSHQSRDDSQEICTSLSSFDELDLASTFLHQMELSHPSGEEGVIWFGFPSTAPDLTFVRRTSKHTTFQNIEISKFCSRPLLQCYMNLCRIFTENYHVNIRSHNEIGQLFSSLNEKYSWCEIFGDAHVVDFGMESWLSLEHHSERQQSMLASIVSSVSDLHENECLVLRCYPMLSEFNVSVVYVLGHLFERFGLLIPDEVEDTVVLLYNFHGFDDTVKSHFEKALTEREMLSLVPLLSIFDGEFYDNIRDVNNLCLKIRAHHILQFVKDMGE